MLNQENNEKYDGARLGKIVQMAKRGTGFEQENAIRLVKSICQKHGLDFDAVMTDIEIQQYFIEYKDDEEKQLLVQIVLRYAFQKIDDQVFEMKNLKRVLFSTTKEMYVETLNAWAVLSKQYQIEKEKIMKGVFYGFLERHNLYYQPTDAERSTYYSNAKKNAETDEQIKARLIGLKLSGTMEKVDIRKTLNSGK